ncbi:phage tail terminator protein [Neptuniibacter sp.]|uniref:phage tail terminator protein n=1 Tax=Neptuniibacter sp. TaxID=1962643 RepID=UPI003B5B4F29
MFMPLDTSLIEQRLRDAVPELKKVEGAAEYAAVQDIRGFTPGSAYVVLAGEKNLEEPEAQPGLRRAARSEPLATFGVIIAVRNHSGRNGSEALKDAMPLIGAVRDALIGWTPGENQMRPIAWVKGDVMDYDKSTLLWADVFTTKRFIGGS